MTPTVISCASRAVEVLAWIGALCLMVSVGIVFGALVCAIRERG